jgi:HK97 family phage portal protein
MLSRIRRWAARIVASVSGTSQPARWLVDWIRGGTESDSGVALDGKTVLRYAPVWYAVNRIAGHLGLMPLVLYRRVDEREVKRATEHPAYRLCKLQPNELMTASVFRETIQYHALVWGNGRAAIVRDRRGDPTDLIPLLPDRTRTFLLNGAKWHATKLVDSDSLDADAWGSPAAGEVPTQFFPDRDVLHIKGLGFDGLSGYPLWDLAKNSFGLGLAGEKHGNKNYRNNGVPGLLLEAPPGVFRDDVEAKAFLQAFRAAQEGLDNVSKTALLREGIKASKIAQTGAELQHLEQRAFQRQEVALWFLLEAITGDDKSVSYGSLEQKHLAYLTNGLGRWLVRWQEECAVKLLREREKDADSHYFAFNTGALLRADAKTTGETLAGLVRGRILTPNEAREKLELNPLPGGDELQNPAIDVRGGGQDQQDQQDEDREDSVDPVDPVKRPVERLKAIVAARLGELEAVERRRVDEVTGKHSGPALEEWREKFYSGWQQTLAAAFEPLAGDGVFGKTLAADWVAAGRAGQAEGRVAKWTERILGH